MTKKSCLIMYYPKACLTVHDNYGEHGSEAEANLAEAINEAKRCSG